MTLTVYLAARFSRKDELAGYAAELMRNNIAVTSRWLFGSHDVPSESGMDRETKARFAIEDLDDIDRADVLVAFTEPEGAGPARGGRHVETGYAIGAGIPVLVVGPIENVFHAIPENTVVETWPEALRLLVAGLFPRTEAA